MSWLAPTILGAGGLALQADSNSDARSNANKALSQQDQELARKNALFDTEYNLVQNADKGGYFDPENTMSYVRGQLGKQEGQDMSNLGGGFATAGYQPGDTAVRDAMASIGAKYSDQLANLAYNAQTSALQNKLNAYGALNGGQALDTGVNAYGQRANQANNQVQSLSSTVSGLMPYLQNAWKTPAAQTNPTLPYVNIPWGH
jgi:hypothetical protein